MSNYGKLETATISHAAYRIWLTRNDELEPCQPFGWYTNSIQESDAGDDHDEGKVLMRFMLAAAATREIHPRFVKVILMHAVQDMTFTEIATAWGVTDERVRQVYYKGIRKVKLLWAQRP